MFAVRWTFVMGRQWWMNLDKLLYVLAWVSVWSVLKEWIAKVLVT